MTSSFKLSAEERENAILSFCESIKINTVSGIGPEGGYQAFVDFLIKELTDAGVDKCWVLPESLEGKPILVATIEGEAPEMAQVLFNAHYDVVPVIEEDWTIPAFDAVRKEEKFTDAGLKI